MLWNNGPRVISICFCAKKITCLEVKISTTDIIQLYLIISIINKTYNKSVNDKSTMNSKKQEDTPTPKGGEISNGSTSKNSLNDGTPPADKTNIKYFKELSKTDLSENDLKKAQNYMKKWFGETDVYSVYIAAGEQENGVNSKKKSKK